MRTHHRPAVSALIAYAGMMLALTACDSDPGPGPETDTATATTDPTTTDPSPTETETTVDYQQQQIDAASQFVHDRYAASSDVANNHYDGWREQVLPYYQGLTSSPPAGLPPTRPLRRLATTPRARRW